MSIKNWPGEVCSVYSITNKLDMNKEVQSWE
jgi:hypothetical protein